MALTTDIDRTENRDFRSDDTSLTRFIDISHNFLHQNTINSRGFERVVLMFSNDGHKSKLDWFLARLNDKREMSELNSIKINIIDYNSSCERCGQKLPPTLPWKASTKLCKSCEAALDETYNHRIPWLSHSNNSTNNNWTAFTLNQTPFNIRTPFADWF